MRHRRLSAPVRGPHRRHHDRCDAPDASVHILGNIKSPVRAHGETRRPERRLARLLHRAGKAVGKDNERSGGLAVGKRLEDHVIAVLRFRRAIPRAVKSNESPTLIAGGKGPSGINQEVVRRPMAGKSSHRRLLIGAHADLLAIAAIVGREHELALQLIVMNLSQNRLKRTTRQASCTKPRKF